MKELIYKSFNLETSKRIKAELQKLDNYLDANKDLLEAKTDDERDALYDYNRDFLTRFVHNSSSIEGTTLTEIETELVLEGEFIPSDDKQVSDMFATKGCYEGYDYMLSCIEENKKLTTELIKDIHQRTALDCQPRTRGSYRNIPVAIKGSKTVPVNVAKIREYMDDLLFAYQNSNLHPVVKCSAFHAMFENIHPFRDGNGRCGRTLLNFMLLTSNYPAIAISNVDRSTYLSALQSWQVDFDTEPLLNLIIACLKTELEIIQEILEETREFALLQ